MRYELRDAITIMPSDGTDPSIHAANELLHKHGFVLEYCGHIYRTQGGPELNVLCMKSSVYIIDLKIFSTDGVDDHCFCFDANRRGAITRRCF